MVTEMRWYCGIRHATCDTRLQGDRRASITRIKVQDTDAAIDQRNPALTRRSKKRLCFLTGQTVLNNKSS
jgi:hypothetical protein